MLDSLIFNNINEGPRVLRRGKQTRLLGRELVQTINEAM